MTFLSDLVLSPCQPFPIPLRPATQPDTTLFQVLICYMYILWAFKEKSKFCSKVCFISALRTKKRPFYYREFVVYWIKLDL